MERIHVTKSPCRVCGKLVIIRLGEHRWVLCDEHKDIK